MELNVYGLVSGINTQEIIDQLIEIQKRPRARIESSLNDLQSQRLLLQEIKARLLTLQTKASGLKMHTTFTSRVGTSSNESIVRISSVSSEAPIGTYQVTVEQLATPSKVKSSAELGAVLPGNEGLIKVSRGKIYFQLLKSDGTLYDSNTPYYAVEISDSSNNTLDKIKNAINSTINDLNVLEAEIKTDGNYKYLQITAKSGHRLKLLGNSNLLQKLDDADGKRDFSLASGNSYQISGAKSDKVTGLGIGTGVLVVNNTDVVIDSDTTLESLMNQLSAAGLSVSYDDTAKTLTISAASNISLAGKTNFFDVIGLTTTATQPDHVMRSEHVGKQGEFNDTDPLVFIDQDDQTPFRSDITPGTFSINGVTLFVDLNDTIDDIVNKINNSGAGVVASYQNGKIRLTQDNQTPWISVGSSGDTSNLLEVVGLTKADQTVTGLTVQVEGLYKLGAVNPSRTLGKLFPSITSSGNFTINGVKIDFDPSDTLQDLIYRINSSEAGVTAYYDPYEDKLNLVSEKTGSPNINLSEGSGGLLSELELDPDKGLGQFEQGQDAEITVNGATFYSNSNVIDNAIPGVSLSLQSSSPGTVVRVTIESDVGGAVGAIQDFVDSFNDTISYIREKVFTRLLPQQETEESEESGFNEDALRNDPVLKSLVRRLNQAVLSQVDGLPSGKNSLISIGIGKPAAKTVTLDQILGGLNIEIRDSAKLVQALKEDPEAVAEIFATTSSSTQGIAEKVESILMGYTKVYTGIIDNRIQAIDQRILETNRKLEDFDKQIEETRRRLNLQYSRLEEALGRLQTQANFLSQQLFNLQMISLMSLGRRSMR
jgi:flagellar capping protein FliD